MRYSTRTSSSQTPSEAGHLDGPVDRWIDGGSGIDFDPRKFDPLLYHLPKVDLAVFGSLTWAWEPRRSDSPWASWGRRQDFNGALHQSCVNVGLRGKDVGIYHATEFGAASQCHLHFLVAKEGLKHVTPEQFSQVFTHQWCVAFKPFNSMKGGVGTAVVKPYEEAYGDRGVAYCLKREFDDHGRQRERYDYLSRKLIQTIRRAGAPQP